MKRNMIIGKYTFTKGDQIQFNTYHPKDTVLWSGKMFGMDCDVELAKLFTDVVAQNEEINTALQQAGLPVNSDIEKLNYFIIETVEGKRRAFAVEWLKSDTVQKVEAAATADIRVFNLNAEQLATVIDMIRSAGYDCRVI